jgi:hypothetical protein
MSEQFKKSFEKFAVEEKHDLKLEDEYLKLEDEDKDFSADEQVASHESLKSEGKNCKVLRQFLIFLGTFRYLSVELTDFSFQTRFRIVIRYSSYD